MSSTSVPFFRNVAARSSHAAVALRIALSAHCAGSVRPCHSTRAASFASNVAVRKTLWVCSGVAHYGWGNINLDVSGLAVTVNHWAYESAPNTAITVGVVPEPSVTGLALLGLGAMGVMRWRKERATLAA